jgi:hypothetical protein
MSPWPSSNFHQPTRLASPAAAEQKTHTKTTPKTNTRLFIELLKDLTSRLLLKTSKTPSSLEKTLYH